MSFTVLAIGAAVVYMWMNKSSSPPNTGGKPQTNVFANGKDYPMNIHNINLSNGMVASKGIGMLGTPKQLVYDRAGVLHELYLPMGKSNDACGCRKDAPMHFH
jgi:hypothetical protein